MPGACERYAEKIKSELILISREQSLIPLKRALDDVVLGNDFAIAGDRPLGEAPGEQGGQGRGEQAFGINS
jgi:hypothetical protein